MIVFTVSEDDKIKDEYARKIYTHLYHQANKDPELAAACRKPHKTLNGVINYIRQRARGREYNGCAVIHRDEVYTWAIQYLKNDALNYEGEVNDTQTDYPDGCTKAKNGTDDDRHGSKNIQMHPRRTERSNTLRDKEELAPRKKDHRAQSKDLRQVYQNLSEDQQKKMIEDFYAGFGITGL